jgi:hypothetical protein
MPYQGDSIPSSRGKIYSGVRLSEAWPTSSPVDEVGPTLMFPIEPPLPSRVQVRDPWKRVQHQLSHSRGWAEKKARAREIAAGVWPFAEFIVFCVQKKDIPDIASNPSEFQ